MKNWINMKASNIVARCFLAMFGSFVVLGFWFLFRESGELLLLLQELSELPEGMRPGGMRPGEWRIVSDNRPLIVNFNKGIASIIFLYICSFIYTMAIIVISEKRRQKVKMRSKSEQKGAV